MRCSPGWRNGYSSLSMYFLASASMCSFAPSCVSSTTRPRIFFPDKANLGGDSWLVQRYAGLRVLSLVRASEIVRAMEG